MTCYRDPPCDPSRGGLDDGRGICSSCRSDVDTCATCRERIVRTVDGKWHHVPSPSEGHAPEPSAHDIAALTDLLTAGRKPTVPEVLPFVRALYAIEPAGGSLHVVLDDGNLADAFVAGCAEDARAAGDRFGELLARVLLLMSRTQRARLIHAR